MRYIILTNLPILIFATIIYSDTFILTPDGYYVLDTEYTLAPDGSYVAGDSAHLAPDGTYIGKTHEEPQYNYQTPFPRASETPDFSTK